MESKGKRAGRTGRKVAEAEVDNVEPVETVKNGDVKKKSAPKGGKAAKDKAVVEPMETEAPEEKKKSGRKGKAAAPEADSVEAPVASEEPAKGGRKGRKPAAAKEEEAPAAEEPPVKKGKGKKAVAAEEPAAPVVENGNSPAKASKGKGKGKAAAKEEVEAAEPEPVAAPAKRGRGKAKADTKEPEEEPASPAKKSKASPKKSSPKKAAEVEPEAESEKVEEEPAAPKAGRGRKKAAEEKQPESPTKSSPKAPAKRGRGKKAAAETEANDESTTKSTKASKKRKTAPKKSEADDEGPLDGVTHRKKQKTDDDAPAATKKAKAEKKPAAPKMNKASTDYASLNFDLPDKEFSFKISNWNVSGLRSWVTKGGLEYFEHEKPDIMCIQETKCTEDQLPEEARHIKGYHPYWLCKPGGYAGVAIYSKKMPLNVTYGLGDAEQDADGRLLTAEFTKFFLVCVYVPNAGRGLVTLPKRMRWDEKFQQYLKDLDSKKPVIVCGDMNVAHEEIDLANPKSNKKNAGFTKEERDGMTKLLSLGFVDTFRRLYPDRKGAYTFWTYMGNARAKNVGWRLDYFITSERLDSKLVDNVIRSEVYGSDHCPLTLFLNI